MKLTYRGVEYDYNPPTLEVTDREILGKYRGRPAHFSYVRHVPITQPVADLKYRGVSYRTNSHGSTEAAFVAEGQPSSNKSVFARFMASSASSSPMAAARRALLQEAAKNHRESIRRSLQHRMQVAQAQGNQRLIEQLEAEMHQIA